MQMKTGLVALASMVAMLLFVALTTADATRETIQGKAAALSAYNPKNANPSIANATLTVTTNGTNTIYYVHGWAGIICAKNDGMLVEVTGVVGQTSSGKLTITARSVDVKVVIVP